MHKARRYAACIPCKQFAVYYSASLEKLRSHFRGYKCTLCGKDITIIGDYYIEYENIRHGIHDLLVLPQEAADRLVTMISGPNDITWWTK